MTTGFGRWNDVCNRREAELSWRDRRATQVFEVRSGTKMRNSVEFFLQSKGRSVGKPSNRCADLEERPRSEFPTEGA
jgi:hypothetical protein